MTERILKSSIAILEAFNQEDITVLTTNGQHLLRVTSGPDPTDRADTQEEIAE